MIFQLILTLNIAAPSVKQSTYAFGFNPAIFGRHRPRQ